MKFVIDSNQLPVPNPPRESLLRRFLSASTRNIAVLTDYAAMEAYKGDTLAGIYKSMSVLSEFPKQVEVLKSTLVVCGLHGRKAGLQRRLVDERQTRGFPRFVAELRRAQQGSVLYQESLLRHGLEANRHLGRLLADAQSTGAAFKKIAALYSKDERRNIREGLHYTDEFINKTVKQVIQIAGLAFREHPMAHIRPSFEEVPNTFIFRVSLCTYLLALDWAANGGAEGATPATLRNDIVDMNFAAYATYFDGLLTSDAKVKRVHAEARLWLSALFQVDMPSGWQGAQISLPPP